MTLNRLLIILLVLMALAGGGIMWFWQYAYSPQGRAKNVLTELRGDTSSPRGWMIKHGSIKRELITEPDVLKLLDDTKQGTNTITPEMIEGDKELGSLFHFDEKAAKKWAQIGPEAMPVVREALNDPAWLVQSAAIKACVNIGDSQAVQILLAKTFSMKVQDDNFLEALGKCRSKQALPVFIEGLHNSNRDVRDYCIKALGDIGNPQAIEPLIAAMHDPDLAAIDSHITLGTDSLDRCADSSSVPVLIRALEDKVAAVRMAALISLERLGDKRAMLPLSTFLARGDDEEIQIALKALYETDDARAAEGLLAVLKRGSVPNRIAAAGILMRMDRKEGLDFLLGLLKGGDSAAMRELADSAMMHTSSMGVVVESLLPLAEDSDWEVRESFAKIMVDLRPTRAVGALQKLLKDPQKEVRLAAQDALEMIAVEHPGSQPATAPDSGK